MCGVRKRDKELVATVSPTFLFLLRCPFCEQQKEEMENCGAKLLLSADVQPNLTCMNLNVSHVQPCSVSYVHSASSSSSSVWTTQRCTVLATTT